MPNKCLNSAQLPHMYNDNVTKLAKQVWCHTFDLITVSFKFTCVTFMNQSYNLVNILFNLETRSILPLIAPH